MRRVWGTRLFLCVPALDFIAESDIIKLGIYALDYRNEKNFDEERREMI